MGTLTITAAGFGQLSSTAPGNWPNDVVWPAGGNPNGTKVYTWSDADWQRTLTWIAGTQPQFRPKPPDTTTTPTAAQILLAYLQVWINGTIQGEQAFSTKPPQLPPPISPT
jgi:hypothetical protein